VKAVQIALQRAAAHLHGDPQTVVAHQTAVKAAAGLQNLVALTGMTLPRLLQAVRGVPAAAHQAEEAVTPP
jgi:hypothetical protein